MDVIARLDAVVDDYNRRNRYFNTPLTRERAEMFVRQHRLNTRQRNSVHKLAVATNCPDWDIRVRIIGASAQEILADNEFGEGKAHWEILEDLGVAIGMLTFIGILNASARLPLVLSRSSSPTAARSSPRC